MIIIAIHVDLISKIPEDADRLQQLLSFIDLGDNVHINIINEPNSKYYNFRITNDGCYEYSKSTKNSSDIKIIQNTLL